MYVYYIIGRDDEGYPCILGIYGTPERAQEAVRAINWEYGKPKIRKLWVDEKTSYEIEI